MRQAQFQPQIALNLVIQNQTVPQQILVMILTTVDFQICHGKMSKKGRSSQVSQVFYLVYLCTFFGCLFYCVYLKEYMASAINSVLCTCIVMGSYLTQSNFVYIQQLFICKRPKQVHEWYVHVHVKSCKVKQCSQGKQAG